MMNKIPENLDEAILILDSLDIADKESWVNKSEESATALAHMGIGRTLRNEWGLWKQDSKLYRYFTGLGIFHPDDMSSIVLTSYHRKKNNEPINLEEQVQGFIKFWKERETIVDDSDTVFRYNEFDDEDE
jgi:hypothetical protein